MINFINFFIIKKIMAINVNKPKIIIPFGRLNNKSNIYSITQM